MDDTEMMQNNYCSPLTWTKEIVDGHPAMKYFIPGSNTYVGTLIYIPGHYGPEQRLEKRSKELWQKVYENSKHEIETILKMGLFKNHSFTPTAYGKLAVREKFPDVERHTTNLKVSYFNGKYSFDSTNPNEN